MADINLRYREKYLEDTKTISFYKIHRYSLVFIDNIDVEVNVKVENEKLIFKVSDKMPATTILMMVEAKTNITSSRLKLFQGGFEINVKKSLCELEL